MELLVQYGSIESAMEPHLAEVEAREKRDKKAKKSKKDKKSKNGSTEEESGKVERIASGGMALLKAALAPGPPVPPAPLGDASPTKVSGYAGMVGMVARGEIQVPGFGLPMQGSSLQPVSAVPNGTHYESRVDSQPNWCGGGGCCATFGTNQSHAGCGTSWQHPNPMLQQNPASQTNTMLQQTPAQSNPMLQHNPASQPNLMLQQTPAYPVHQNGTQQSYTQPQHWQAPPQMPPHAAQFHSNGYQGHSGLFGSNAGFQAPPQRVGGGTNPFS